MATQTELSNSWLFPGFPGQKLQFLSVDSSLLTSIYKRRVRNGTSKKKSAHGSNIRNLVEGIRQYTADFTTALSDYSWSIPVTRYAHQAGFFSFFILPYKVWSSIVIVHGKSDFIASFFRNISKTAETILIKKIRWNDGISVYKKSLISEHRKNYIFRDNNCFVEMSVSLLVSLYVTNFCGRASSKSSVNIQIKVNI